MLTEEDSARWCAPDWVKHVQILLDSYQRLLGAPLVERTGNALEEARVVWEAPFVVVSHGIEDDPVLNYGNRVALQLWEMDIATFTSTPSRKTAEPVHRDERARMLKRTTEVGFIDDYRGVRISSTGQRFLIRQAIIWNLSDSSGNRIGQAATFSHWEMLGSEETPVSPGDSQ